MQTNSDFDIQKMCKAWGKVCDKCKKTNNFSSQCYSSPKSNTKETPALQDNSEVGGITGYIFGIHDATRTEHQQQIWDMQPTM